MPAVAPEVSVSRVPTPAQSTGVRPQAGANAPSDPFAALLEGSEGAPDALTALLAATQMPGVPEMAEGVKAEQKPDIPGAKGLAQAVARTQAHGLTPPGLAIAIAKTAGLASAPHGKKPDTPAETKASPSNSAPAEAQPDAQVPAPPKPADTPDDVEADAAAAMPTLPAVPAVPLPAPAPTITATPSADGSETTPAVASVSADAKPAPAADAAIAAMAAEAAPVATKPTDKADKAAGAGQPDTNGEKRIVAAAKTTTDEPAPETETVAAKPVKSAALPDSTPAKSKGDAETEKTADPAADLPVKAPQLDGDTQKAKAPAPSADAATNANANAVQNAPTLPAPAMTHSPASHGVPQMAQVSTTANAVPIAGVAVEIAAHARDGKNHFEIRLDPPDLGRIDVRMHIDNDGQVTSHLRVDRVETLDLLRRDAPALERALQDAGLKTGDSALQFSLRDQNLSQHNQNREAPPTSARLVLPDEASATAETRRHYGRLAGLGGGVDISV